MANAREKEKKPIPVEKPTTEIGWMANTTEKENIPGPMEGFTKEIL